MNTDLDIALLRQQYQKLDPIEQGRFLGKLTPEQISALFKVQLEPVPEVIPILKPASVPEPAPRIFATNLIPCPGCTKEVSSQAKSCPHCGHPLNPVKISTTEDSDFIFWGWVGFAVLLVVCVIGYSIYQDKAKTEDTEWQQNLNNAIEQKEQERIQRGLLSGQPVVGMNARQVYQTWGVPKNILSGDQIGEGHALGIVEMWMYNGKNGTKSVAFDQNGLVIAVSDD